MLDGFAPAKVNLALHVTGKRADGYHLLDSLVVFADVGDRLAVAPAETLGLEVHGPRAAGVPTDHRNLVWRAAQMLSPDRGAAITLDKHLPHAGGIGGGSSDAACALRLLSQLWQIPLPKDTSTLGADIPVCLRAAPTRMSGIGEVLEDVPKLPPLWIVLVNAGVEVPTGRVFSAMAQVDNAPMPAPAWQDFDSLIAWLARTRNDMQTAAKTVAPVISEVLSKLDAAPGAALARMSGSGGTCFALFRDQAQAETAAASMPLDWWSVSARILDAPA